MGEGIKGIYQGEGPNVSSPKSAPAQIDVPARTVAITPSNPTGKNAIDNLTIDRMGRARTSSEGARSMTAISYGGGDQILAQCARAIYITTAGTLVLRCAEDTADQTVAGLLVGTVYSFHVALIRQTGSTAAGFLLF